MRIISGEARGRTLFAPLGEQTRPTSDKIRGSLFNILGSRVVDAQVLDLFGGTGALALEALSRGAKHAVISDSAINAYRVILRNAASVLKEGLSRRSRILKADYRSAISGLGEERFDLVFLDPPYRMTEAYADAIARLEAAGRLSEDVIIVCERHTDAVVSVPEGFCVTDSRIYGDTSIDFVCRRVG